MNIYTTPGSVTITCHKRTMPYLEQEVRELGFTPTATFITGVKLKATVNECIRLNLNLRCASQVLYSLQSFQANNADEVYKNLLNYPWENILPLGAYFSITSNVSNSTINNSMYANLRVKDAIIDRLRDKTGKRPSTGSDLGRCRCIHCARTLSIPLCLRACSHRLPLL